MNCKLQEKIDLYLEYRGHIAFLISSNKIIYIGKSKAIPYFKNSNGGICSIHAEQSVIQNLKKDQRVYNMCVFRWDKNGHLAESKPCRNCLKQIQKFKNISTIYYSTKKGFVKECPGEMDISECYQSSGYRYRKRLNKRT